MRIRFVDRNPADHQALRDYEMDAIPREGDAVTINDIPRTVHQVSWDINRAIVTVLLS
jgi:hypothetical protein